MDTQYSQKQIAGALSACRALQAGAKSAAERRLWEKAEDVWKQRLKTLQQEEK